MKLSKLTIIFLFTISAFSGYGMTESYGRLEFNRTQSEHTDSLTIIVFVSFMVNENGKVSQPKVEKTECSEYDIKQLDKKAVKKLEQEALQVIKEMDDLDSIEKPTRYTLPIKMKLPANQYLKSN